MTPQSQTPPNPTSPKPTSPNPISLPDELVEVSQTQLTGLRRRLVDAAAREGLLDIAYTRVDSPVGPLLLAATEAGVVRVAFECQDHDAVLADLAMRVSTRVLRAPARLDGAARQLEEYFEGRRRTFDLAVDRRLVSGFADAVLRRLAEIPYGRTSSYAALAAAAGSPRAVRAVGTVCARNPVPLLLPCHRVVRSDGSTGGYAGGAEAKTLLLHLESR